MKFQKIDDRHYKVNRDAKGSNQYVRRVKVRRHPKVRGVLAFITLMTILISVLYLNITQPAQAAMKAEQPKIVTVVENPDMKKVEAFMKKQVEINQKTVQWMKLQEALNNVMQKGDK